jgi:HNH endonuclease
LAGATDGAALRKTERERREQYEAYIASDAWKAKRKLAFATYGKVCARCGGERKTLHVHHRTYVRFGGDELVEDLEVLCIPCHEKHHGKKKVRKKAKAHAVVSIAVQQPEKKKRKKNKWLETYSDHHGPLQPSSLRRGKQKQGKRKRAPVERFCKCSSHALVDRGRCGKCGRSIEVAA